MAPTGGSVKNSSSFLGEPHPMFRSRRSCDDEISEFGDVDYNCPADNSPEWVRTVTLVLTGVQ